MFAGTPPLLVFYINKLSYLLKVKSPAKLFDFAEPFPKA